jgi:UDP-N-acetylglucosamine 2-epimerase
MEVSKYPEDILEVTGSPRYDILTHFDKIYKKEDIFNRLSELSGTILNPKKKTILLLTQPLFSLEDRELLLKYTYRAVKKLKDVQLIVKMHPGESDSKMHRRLAHEEGLREVVIVENFDTYELLYVCDLAISAFSTAQLEAIALGKPTISIDTFKRLYWADLDEDGVIASVSDEDSLTRLIHSVLFNPEFSADLANRIAKFKYNHLCNVDGLASERIVKLIYTQIDDFAFKKKNSVGH